MRLIFELVRGYLLYFTIVNYFLNRQLPKYSIPNSLIYPKYYIHNGCTFFLSMVIFLSAVSSIESTAQDVLPTGEPVIPVHDFHKTSHHGLPTGEPAPFPVHVYPLSEHVLPPKSNHVLPTGEPVTVPTNVLLQRTPNHISSIG